MWFKLVTAEDYLSRAKAAANVMPPCYIWPGLCKQLGRKPTADEWDEVIKNSPFTKGIK